MSRGALPRKHYQLALHDKKFTAQNLLELQKFRDRMGWQRAFLEDVLLEGFLAARSSRGQKQQLKEMAIQEMKDKVAKEIQVVDREVLARQLIGPRGGLPAVKADMTRLAHLVNVEVNPKDTIPILQEKVRPLVAAIMGKYPSYPAPSSKTGDKAPKAKAPSPKATSSAESTSSTWSVVSPTDLSGLEVRVGQMLQAQDERFQGMLSQVMQHVMALQNQNPPPVPIVDLEEDEKMDGR